MKYKIKRGRIRHEDIVFCGLERMEQGAFDLVARLNGVTVNVDGDCMDPSQPAFIKAGAITGTVEKNTDGKTESYVTIALGSLKTETEAPSISVRIDKRKFKELRRMLDYVEKM